MGDAFFLIFGIVVAAFGFLFLFLNILLRIRCSKMADGTVSQIKKEHFKIRGAFYYRYRPVYTYLSEDGQMRKAEAPYRRPGENTYKIGDHHPIYYNPKAPDVFCFRNRVIPLIVPSIVMLVGILFIALYFI